MVLKEQIQENLEVRSDHLRNVDQAKLTEALLEQMNMLRMSGVNLCQDMDKLVNDYLQVCKNHPIK
jgi:hypothetical protein